MRPKHWVKNILVFTALVFSRNLGNAMAVAQTIAAFAAFCLLSSGCYLINDVLDRKNDILHPIKQNRPIAQGRIKSGAALFWAIILFAVGLVVARIIGHGLFYMALGFILVGIFYSILLKHLVIQDVFAIAAGFIIRTMAGAAAIHVPISSWLLICTLLLSLFLGLTKRSLEMKLLEENASAHRPSLAHYNPYLLDQMNAVITSAILITYTLYTLSETTADKFEGHGLLLTVPVVLYGIFRYLYLVHQKEVTSTLEAALVHDRPMMIAMFIYVVLAFAAIYI